MSFVLAHQNKNKNADNKTSTSAKPFPHYHINNLPMDSHDSIIHLHTSLATKPYRAYAF